MKKSSYLLKRVDLQVSLFVAVIVAILTLTTFLLQYNITYRDTIRSLNDRVDSIYGFLSEQLDTSTFYTISEKEDVNSPEYLEMHRLFEAAKEATGVMYLYTARQDADGNFVYVIDGLDPDSPDFRYPGDLIEPEIYGDMNRALGGEAVLPNEIKDTDWGKIFITYLPIYEGENVIGVIGIEFEADHTYTTYRNLRLMSPVLILLFSIIASLIARFLFRQISNPFYRNMANTDYLTSLKNRNAYQLDIDNLLAREAQEQIGIVVIDLNNLKKVNDTYGHDAGDQYITNMAQAYKNLDTKDAVMYRSGGDEFVLLYSNATEEAIQTLMTSLTEEFQKLVSLPEQSFSWGFAIYDAQEDETLYSTYRRADKSMYANKQAFHQAEKHS